MKKIIIGVQNRVEIDLNDEFFDYIVGMMEPKFIEFIDISEEVVFIKDLLPSFMNQLLRSMLNTVITRANTIFASQNEWQDFLRKTIQFEVYTADMYTRYKNDIGANVTLVCLLAETCNFTNVLLGETR